MRAADRDRGGLVTPNHVDLAALADAMVDRLAERLDAQFADLIATKLADHLADRAAGELIDAKELSDRIGRSRDFVYEHAADLGAIPLGSGPRPRLAFRWPQVLDRIDQIKAAAPSSPPIAPPRPRHRRPDATLLPIRGQSREQQ
jgi:hypothetical protein